MENDALALVAYVARFSQVISMGDSEPRRLHATHMQHGLTGRPLHGCGRATGMCSLALASPWFAALVNCGQLFTTRGIMGKA
jgi:hypothetical protein